MAQVRDDERFKAVGPDSLIIDVISAENLEAITQGDTTMGEAWVDWLFVEFIKGSYCSSIPLLD